MKRHFIFMTFLLIILASCSHSARTEVETMSVPDQDTLFAKGVSGLYAGFIKDRLIVAGGCNFPYAPLTEGGSKKYYSEVYSGQIAGSSITWEKVGEMPFESGYGACLEFNDELIFIGGMNSDRRLSSVLALSSADGKYSWRELPSLPCGVDNFSACVVDGRIVVVGGNHDGVPSNKVLSLDLRDNESEGWKYLEDLPGLERLQSVSASVGDRLFVFGGNAQAMNDSLQQNMADALVYSFGDKSWTKIEGPRDADGNPLLIAGGSALSRENSIILLGGVNYEIFRNAINGRYEQKDYLSHPADWYKFNRDILSYDVESGEYRIIKSLENTARAGASVLSMDGSILVIGGELKPGVRTGMISRIPMEYNIFK